MGPPTGAGSIDVSGTPFAAARRTVSDAHLVAKGKSFLSYMYVGICSSVLYLDPSAPNDAVLFRDGGRHREAEAVEAAPADPPGPQSPIALELCYHQPVRAADFRWATAKFAAQNGLVAGPVQELLEEFNSLYRDVGRGDRYLLEYDPGRGISLSLNGGEVLGSVGAGTTHERELARSIYSIWFGEAAFSEKMKKDLLKPIERTGAWGAALGKEEGRPPRGRWNGGPERGQVAGKAFDRKEITQAVQATSPAAWAPFSLSEGYWSKSSKGGTPDAPLAFWGVGAMLVGVGTTVLLSRRIGTSPALLSHASRHIPTLEKNFHDVLYRGRNRRPFRN